MAKKKSGGMIKVDFTGVEAGGGGGRLLPEGPFKFEVVAVTEEEGADSGEPYLRIEMEVIEHEDDAMNGTKAWDNMSLQPQALWKLRGFLEAAGYKTEDGPMNINPDDLVGLIVDADVIHEEYKGKNKHRIAGYSLPEAAEETAAPTTSKKKKVASDEDSGSAWKVKQRVSFKDGKKTLVGTITKIEGDVIDVKVGSDEYELSPEDISAA